MATKDFSSKQEKMIAEYLGWRVVSGSGAARCYPGDIIGDGWLGECKTHMGRDHKIFFSASVWNKIVEEATKEHRSPVLFTDDGSQASIRTWCVFPEFRVDAEWERRELKLNSSKNINLSHQELYAIYSSLSHVCYIASLGDHKVGILPLSLFNEMFIK